MTTPPEALPAIPVCHSRQGIMEIIAPLPFPVLVLDETHCITLSNAAAGSRYRFPMDKSLGHGIGCGNHGAAKDGCGTGQNCGQCPLRKAVSSAVTDGVGRQGLEFTMELLAIGRRRLRASTAPISLIDRPAAICVLEDRTDVVSRNAAHRECQRLDTALRTARDACHELNQPLTAVLGLSDLLLDDYLHRDIRQDNLLELKRQAERMTRITRNLISAATVPPFS